MTPGKRLSAALTDYQRRWENAKDRADAYRELMLRESALFLLDCKAQQPDRPFSALFRQFLEEFPFLPSEELAFLVAQMAKESAAPLPDGLKPTRPFPREVCLFSGPHADITLGALEKRTQVYYEKSFEGCLLKTAKGERESCLLPFITEDDTPLPAFSALIDRYGLKKCRRIAVETGELSAVYLLLSKDLRPPAEPLFYEVQAEATPAQTEKLLSLARRQGVKTTFPSPLSGTDRPGGERELRCLRFTLSGSPEQISPLLSAMGLIFEELQLSGAYDEVLLCED